MATDLVELLSRLSLPTAPLPNYLDQTFSENATRRAPQAIAFIPPPVVPIPEPATFFIGFGGAYEDACGFAASSTVTGNNGNFCNCTTFTGAIFAAASTGTWYVSDGSQYVSVSITNGNPVATVTSECSVCAITTTTTSTTTTTTTLDCAQTGSVFPTSSLDCVLTGSVIINVDPPPTTTTTTTSTTTTTTTLCPIECALTGSARVSINDDCNLTGSVYPLYVPPTTTTSTTTTTTTVPPTTTTTTTVAPTTTSTTTSTTTAEPTTTTSTTTSTTTVTPTTTTSTTTSTTTVSVYTYILFDDGGYGDATTACTNATGSTISVYSPDSNVSTVSKLYDTIDMDTPLNGNNNWWVYYTGSAIARYAAQIDTTGSLSGNVECV